mgnify:CR=1 FL=1
MAKSTIALPLDTKLKLIAIHKETFEESSKIITYNDFENYEIKYEKIKHLFIINLN